MRSSRVAQLFKIKQGMIKQMRGNDAAKGREHGITEHWYISGQFFDQALDMLSLQMRLGPANAAGYDGVVHERGECFNVLLMAVGKGADDRVAAVVAF